MEQTSALPPAEQAAGLVPFDRAALPLLPGLEDGVQLHETLIRAQSDLGDGVVLMEDERFVYVNDAFCRITGYTRQDLSGPEFRLDHLWAPHERERMRERMRRRLAGEVLEDHYEVALAPLWGPLVHCEVSVKPIHALPGRRLRFAVIRDVTERKRAQEDLEAARRELTQSEKLAALGSLVAGVAHEVRTPIAYIQNNLFLVRTRLDRLERGECTLPEALEEIRACLRSAEEGVDRANDLVRDLSRFTRLPAEPTRCRLDDVVAEALDLFRVTHPGVSACVLAELEPTPTLMLDRSKVQQVVLNLVGNASEALPYGGTIRVATRGSGSGALLVVEDDGPGIPQEDLGRVFQPFYTTKDKGMGLGLHIVRRIVDLHRGTIRCESVRGRGTTFTIQLPA